jgi:hypothetical protein
MHAVKLKTHIGPDHRIELQVPAELPEGDAEVILLVPDKLPREEAEQRRYLAELFSSIDASDRPRRSKEEIDRYLAKERASWE